MVTAGLESVAAALVGAFLSGLVGVGVFEYRNLKENHNERREWYNKLIRICDIIKTTTPELSNEVPDSELTDEQMEQKKHAKRVYAFAYQSLIEHASSPPSTVSSELIEDIDSLSKNCYLSIEEHESFVTPSMSRIGSTPTYDRFSDYCDDTTSKAKGVKQRAEEEHDKIGFL